MQLRHIKLRNGEDIIAMSSIDNENKTVVLENPIKIEVDPDRGHYGINWLFLSDSNNTRLPFHVILHMDVASKELLIDAKKSIKH